jgi:glycosyl transferase family 1
LSNWRKHCGLAACYLAEAWETTLPRDQIEMLRDFDHIFVGVRSAVSTIASITKRPCTFVPMGVDTLRFCPWPNSPERVINVCGIGRRSQVTHEALLSYAERTNAFYYYDTLYLVGPGDMSFAVKDQREHRLLLANLLKRSRYFIANRAFADRPALTDGMEEVPARFYEGAAAGAVMLGTPPETEDFFEQFGWKDAVIRTPFHASEIADVIDELDADPARVDALRKQNVKQALLRHDWVYRLRMMLEILGLRPTEGMHLRERQLSSMADSQC